MSDIALYTCLSCHVAFNSSTAQREHFHSDWHRYNLKRKVAELPPVTAEVFKEKVLAQKSQAEQSELKRSVYCQSCKKSFTCEKSFQNHIQSKKHIQKSIQIDTKDPTVVENISNNETDTDEEDVEVEEVDSDEWNGEPLSEVDCLFCQNLSSDLDENIKHMTICHTFFIPDFEYCISVKELIVHLGEKVGCDMMCIWCNKHFYSLEAVQKHMIDKSHCKLNYEGEALLEYCDYYDYSSSYPDAEYASPDEEVSQTVVNDDDYQLVLPSGATIGHRSLQRYYKRARDVTFMRNIQSKNMLSLSVKANKLQKHFRAQVNV